MEPGGRAAGGAGAAGVPGKSCTSGTVVALHPRRNYIIRRASNLSKESHIIAANIDQALLVVSLVRPATNSEFIDRFLVTAGAYHIPAAILLNKSDLYTTGELQQQRAGLSKPIPVRATTWSNCRLRAAKYCASIPRARGGRKPGRKLRPASAAMRIPGAARERP